MKEKFIFITINNCYCKIFIVFILACLTILYTVNNLYTEEIEEEAFFAVYDQRVIKDIIIVGNEDTLTSQIYDYLKIKKGDIFNAEKLIKDLQNLRNTGLFYRVKAKCKPIGVNYLEITLLVEDKWTLLPIISVQGDIPSYTVGLYDLNFLGRMFEIGGAYINEQKQNYYMLWYINPNFLNSDFPLSIIVFRKGLVNTYYDLNKQEREIAEFKHVRNGGFIESGKYFYDNFKMLLRYTWYNENITKESGGLPTDDSPETLSLWEELEEQQRIIRTFSDESSRSGILTLNFIFGRLNVYDNYLLKGYEVQLVLSHEDQALGSTYTYNQLFVMGRYLFTISDNVNIGLRLSFAKRGLRQEHYDLTMGGFMLSETVTGMNTTSGISTIRGFNPTQFHGNNMYFGNAEIRYPLIDSDNVPFIKAIVIQTTAFIDYGYIWGGSYFNMDKTFNDIYLSSGAGATFIFKKVANFIIRLQVVMPLRPSLETETGSPDIKFITGSTQHF